MSKVLKVLQKKLITRELLQETQVGKTISSLKNISDESAEAKDVKQLSDGLVEHWKKLLKMEKQGAVKVAGNGK